MQRDRNRKTGSQNIFATEMLKSILLHNKLTAAREPPQPADTITWMCHVSCFDRPPEVASALASMKGKVKKLLPGSNLEGKVKNKTGK